MKARVKYERDQNGAVWGSDGSIMSAERYELIRHQQAPSEAPMPAVGSLPFFDLQDTNIFGDGFDGKETVPEARGHE